MSHYTHQKAAEISPKRAFSSARLPKGDSHFGKKAHAPQREEACPSIHYKGTRSKDRERPLSGGEVSVVGAGLGGLAATALLAAKGYRVTVFEQHSWPGGKMRTMPSPAGPVDAGPTVLTLRPVLDSLFKAAGAELSDYLTLVREPLLARHFWPGGASLDLFDDVTASADAIAAFSGSTARRAFERFFAETESLYEAFADPIMWRHKPGLLAVIAACLKTPSLLAKMAPGQSLYGAMLKRFDDPRLAQLFARYATYVGGVPTAAPALLSLIWQAEAQGVWRVDGGMANVALALEALARRSGAQFHYQTAIADCVVKAGRICGVVTAKGAFHSADAVIFNGDPAALAKGYFGASVSRAVRPDKVRKRALSAYVWSFAARPSGVTLAHNNVFFNESYPAEFDAIARGDMPTSATLYVCAQDRGSDLETAPSKASGDASGKAGETAHGIGHSTATERFEIIMNAAPCPASQKQTSLEMKEEKERCQKRTFQQLRDRGLTFDPPPPVHALTTPSDFAHLFPASDGSLYGQSPNGMMATFQRPTIQTPIKGLFLAGGGVHPGAGVPMALTSGKQAAAATETHLHSISTSRPTVTPGGMSMGSATMAKKPSLSSDL